MIAVDTNILVYAHRKDSEWHSSAKAAFDHLYFGQNAWAIPWPCLHEFYSVCTHPKIYAPPSSGEVVLEMFFAWENAKQLRFLHEGPGYLDKLGDLAKKARIKGAAIHDARIAAICLNHRVTELWTADRDFSSFPDLKIRNPLINPVL
ncbi:MAG: PIN domain-containing protein [Verrucomicrobia bacterium]|nr:PIN domain-containing protein [Verrucomicrobiota bacterium]